MCSWEGCQNQSLQCEGGQASHGLFSIPHELPGALANGYQTLVGHGGVSCVKNFQTCTGSADCQQEINDLASSPDNPQIIASASDDTTVRIWSLDPVHAQQPCVCLLGGEGHSWSLLSAASNLRVADGLAKPLTKSKGFPQYGAVYAFGRTRPSRKSSEHRRALVGFLVGSRLIGL